MENIRQALSELACISYEIVKANRSITMGGVTYRNPKYAALAKAMTEAFRVLDQPLPTC